MKNLYNGIYRNKNVLITGHTGFKGSWLSLWLTMMDANVVGYSLAPPTTPNHFELLNLDMVSIIGDIKNREELNAVILDFKPDIVFHLAAQPLVRLSYSDPVETYETNIIGTLNLFEACRKNDIQAIINITSDKCYENKEWVWGYRECDPMGGYDPYSSSKACVELLTTSYRNSFFNPEKYIDSHNTLLASCRAGNVVGGGDWSQDRIMTDIVVSASKGRKAGIRNPKAIRPWQHVLDPLSGYLHVGQKLLEGEKMFAEGWNFGPGSESNITVEEVVLKAKKYWDEIDYEILREAGSLHEARSLKLDCSKAHDRLRWKSVWNGDMIFEKTVNWYKTFYEGGKILTPENIMSFVFDAKNKNLEWAEDI